jgi:hypothetical protein
MRNFLRVFAMIALAAFSPAGFAAPNPNGNLVDVELVIAVDVSYSMDSDEQALQRDGYTDAILSQDFLNAVRKGPNGRIAVAYVEWAGANDQRLIVPWQIIDGPESADAFVHELQRTPPRRASRTSISGGLIFSAELFEQSPYKGLRRVIDVSGDGTNNQGRLVAPTRDELVAKGITINGLPIMLKESTPGFLDIPNLDEYYRDCVIGGPGAFMVPARERKQFVEAIRRKLLLEVAGLTPEETLRPRLAAGEPRVSCTIGEKMWGERWGTDH